MKAAILTDTTKCIGCNQCVIECKRVNHLAPDAPRRWDRRDGLSARNWTSIVEGPRRTFARKQCRHCLDPACVSACPVGALSRTELGAVVYDSAKCIGCRYCMMACPYGIPRYEWQQPIPYVQKCIFCYDRIRSGGQPGCTEVCPTQATVFGDRDALVAEAQRRIRESPGRYVDRVWGEHELGGTSVLYVSNVDLSFLSSGVGGETTPRPETTALAMHAVPFAFTGVVALMAGSSWIIGRRMKRRSENPDE
jgi:formate dehydrogenase iron-sulfur subunit